MAIPVGHARSTAVDHKTCQISIKATPENKILAESDLSTGFIGNEKK
jgi:hypothetical protein